MLRRACLLGMLATVCLTSIALVSCSDDGETGSGAGGGAAPAGGTHQGAGGQATGAGGTAQGGAGAQGGGDGGSGAAGCEAEVPSVTALEPASVSHGQSVVVRGCGFGAKSHVAPLRWDDFESSTDGADVADSGYWTNSGADIHVTSEANRHPRGSRSVVARLAYGTSNGNFYHLDTWTEPGAKYVSGYLRVDMVNLNTSGDWQAKLIHLLAGSEHADMPVLALQSWWTETGEVGANSNYWEFNSVDGQWIPSLWDDWARAGEWFRFEISFRDSSDANSPDGEGRFVAYHLDGSVASQTRSGITQSQAGRFLTTPHFGYAIVNVNTGHEVHTTWDDLYLDDTWARVEVCDTPSFDARTHCELQVPEQVWQSDEVHVRVNQGSFPAGTTAYLFVIGADGSPSAAGRPISFP